MATAASTAAQMIPSSQRPIPLRLRPDLFIRKIFYRGVAFPVVKDPCGLKYYRLQPEQYAVLLQLDGETSLEDIRESLQQDYPTIPITLTDVQSLITDLHEKSLLISERSGQGLGLLRTRRDRKRKEWSQILLNPLYLKLPGWDPDRVLTAMTPWVGWIFRPGAVVPTLIFVLFAYLFLAVRFDELRQKLPEFQQFFGWPNLIYLWITLGAVKILHEFGHGVACKHFGSECHSMGVMLLVFSPTLYCDVTDSWMMPDKWKRIFIGAAGMYVEVVLAAVAIFVWWWTEPGVLHHLALNIFFVSSVTTVIFNANPLLRYDGYYMLLDYLEIPNLRPKASQLLQHSFAWYCLGIELRRDAFMPTSGQFWFILFVIASTIYRWVVLASITLFLYTVLKPYRLQEIGITMAVISIGAIFVQLGRTLYQLLSMPRSEPLSKPKIAVTLAGLVLLLGGLLFVPFPWYLDAPFTIEPVGVHHVYNLVSGQLKSIRVEPGQNVTAGDTLIDMQNLDLEQHVRELEAEVQSQQLEAPMYRRLGARDEQVVAEQRQAALQNQVREASEELNKLAIIAPVAGKVIAPPRIPVPKVSQTELQLPRWNGTPLDPRNVGTYFDERTHVCSIAPEQQFEAIMLIDQADRSEADIGRPVRLKIELLPNLVLDGQITRIADRHREIAPPSLSNKYGGPLATVSDATGEEKLTNHVYEATVKLTDIDPALLRTGLRGEARMLIGHRSLGEWLWRYLRSTFKFRL
ncbi:MAG: hypothetical protein ACK5Q5_08210 [Planctomycetaceae bacterium]